MSADSRLLKQDAKNPEAKYYSDDSQKIWVTPGNVGISQCGTWPAGELDGVLFTPNRFMGEFGPKFGNMNVRDVATTLCKLVYEGLGFNEVSFMVGGYLNGNPIVYSLSASNEGPHCDIVNGNDWNNGIYSYVDSLRNDFLKSHPSIDFDNMSENEAVAYMQYVTDKSGEQLIKENKDHMIGGPVDILKITTAGSEWVQKKAKGC